jgi:hypothetical protein
MILFNNAGISSSIGEAPTSMEEMAQPAAAFTDVLGIKKKRSRILDIKSIPPTLQYEPGTIVAEGDLVIVHGRFSAFGAPVNWIAADIVRIQNGILAEHWDVIQDEATEEQSKSGAPMFGKTLPKYKWEKADSLFSE